MLSLKGGVGVLRYKVRLCIPNFDDVKEQFLKEADSSRLFIHPGETKMYRDLQYYCWNGMKNGNRKI